MKKQILAQFNNPDLVLFAFLLFLITFLGVVIWTFRKTGKGHYEKMSLAPIDEKRSGEFL